MKPKKTRTRALTEKQAAFAFAYISNGRNATQAYKDTYNLKVGKKEEYIWNEAHKVLYNPKVASRVNELQMQKYDGDIMSLAERKQMLTSLARVGDKQAVDMLNKMDGVYVVKTEVKHEGEVRVRLGFKEFYKKNDEQSND